MNDEVSRARIALVGPMPPTKGGITTFMLNLMSSYLAEEFEFVPYTITRPPKPYVVDNYGYGAVLRGGLRRVSLGIGLTALRLFQFPQFVLRNSIDLVQVHASDYQSFWEGVAYILLGRALRRPTVLRLGGHFDHFHQNSGPFGRRLIGWALQISNVLIVQSQFTADYVKQCGRERRVIVLSNWVPNELLTLDSPKNTQQPRVLFIAGTEALRKGIQEVIQAMEALHKERASALFHLVGVQSTLLRRISSLGLSNIAEMVGFVSHDALLDRMRQTDIFLLPSHGEGFPNSLIEAMALRAASIATPIAAVPEILSDGGGILVPVGDAAALTAAIRRLLQSSDERCAIGQKARQTVEARYTDKKVLPILALTYREILSGQVEIAVPASGQPVAPSRSAKLDVLMSYPSLDTRENVSGVSTVAHALLAALRDQVQYWHVPAGASQKGVWFLRRLRSVIRSLHSILVLIRSRAKIFHSNTALERNSILRDFLLLYVAHLTGKRILLHLHGGRYLECKPQGLVRLVMDVMLKLSDTIVFLSESESRGFLSSRTHLAAKSTSIYNFIDQSVEDVGSEKKPQGDGFAAIFAGRLVREKGVEVLLTAARSKFEYPIRFAIYGDGPLRTLVQDEERENSQLSFRGTFRREEWNQILSQYDVLVLPSLFGEGMPMAILEAMWLGIIPIATAIASVSEILGNGERGIIIPRNDPNAIVQAIDQVQRNPEWRRTTKRKCIEFAHANFSSRNAQKFFRAYQALSKNDEERLSDKHSSLAAQTLSNSKT